MVDLIDEVKEDMKREKYTKVFTTYGRYVIIISAIILATTAGTTWYKKDQRAKRWEASNTFHTAAVKEQKAETANAENKPKEELNDLRIQAADAYKIAVEKASSGYAELAELRAANLLAKANKADEAIAAFDAIKNKGSYTQETREYADLQGVVLRINAGSGDAAKIKQRLDELSAEGKPWKYSALEAKAFFLISQDKQTEAINVFKVLKNDPTISAPMKDRAEKMVTYLSRDLEDYNPFQTEQTKSE